MRLRPRDKRTYRGTVRFWMDDDGWGVVDSPDVESGIWVHFGAVEGPGYKRLAAGEPVELRCERGPQDGWDFRATWLRRLGP